MRFLLACAILFGGIAPSAAQNVISIQLLAATQVERNIGFSLALRQLDLRCDVVQATRFRGAIGAFDKWEARCHDGHTYTLAVAADEKVPVKLLSCQKRGRTNKSDDRTVCLSK